MKGRKGMERNGARQCGEVGKETETQREKERGGRERGRKKKKMDAPNF